MHQKSKVVFIDRDGVINVDLGGYVTRPEDFRFEKGAVQTLKALSDRGFQIVIISNQAGIGDGVFSREQLDAVQRHMLDCLNKENVRIAGTYYCIHGKQAGCGCRKPKTGLFEQAAAEFYFNPQETYFIGDKAGDIQAGKSFGLKTVLVRTGYGREDESKLTGGLAPDYVVDSLGDAAGLECFR